MTVSTFFPDPHTEVTSVDGQVAREEDGVWATIHDGAGDTSSDDSSSMEAGISPTPSEDVWGNIRRTITLFDTSALGDTKINSATWSFVGTALINNLTPTQSLALVGSTPASNTAIVDADYGQLGTTRLATDQTLASLTIDAVTYNDFALNAAGLTAISKTGISKFGQRLAHDADDVEPTHVVGQEGRLIMKAADTTGTNADPKLIVVHSDGGGPAGSFLFRGTLLFDDEVPWFFKDVVSVVTRRIFIT